MGQLADGRVAPDARPLAVGRERGDRRQVPRVAAHLLDEDRRPQRERQQQGPAAEPQHPPPLGPAGPQGVAPVDGQADDGRRGQHADGRGDRQVGLAGEGEVHDGEREQAVVAGDHAPHERRAGQQRVPADARADREHEAARAGGEDHEREHDRAEHAGPGAEPAEHGPAVTSSDDAVITTETVSIPAVRPRTRTTGAIR